MREATARIPINELISLLNAITDRDWEQFKEIEKQFVAQHSIEIWQDFFAFRLKPALDWESDRWLLGQWCSEGIVSVRIVSDKENF